MLLRGSLRLDIDQNHAEIQNIYILIPKAELAELFVSEFHNKNKIVQSHLGFKSWETQRMKA